MLKAELQRLRDDNSAIEALLQNLEDGLALPLPPEPPFQVMADVIALQDHVYALARRVGSMKREIRDRILQQALAADFSLQGEDISEAVRLGL
jgi:cell division protein FtsB